MAANKKGEPPKFLAGWKDIAGYLGKGVRTVQRYEHGMGLPIRRPAGRSRAAVVATKAELDAWVAASPYRVEFNLQRVSAEYGASNAILSRSVEEMGRLKQQMADLRNELKASVALLRESIQTVHKGMDDSWRNRRLFSVDDFEDRSKAGFDLLGTGKAS
jgi:hypothetical protein